MIVETYSEDDEASRLKASISESARNYLELVFDKTENAGSEITWNEENWKLDQYFVETLLESHTNPKSSFSSKHQHFDGKRFMDEFIASKQLTYLNSSSVQKSEKRGKIRSE